MQRKLQNLQLFYKEILKVHKHKTEKVHVTLLEIAMLVYNLRSLFKTLNVILMNQDLTTNQVTKMIFILNKVIHLK